MLTLNDLNPLIRHHRAVVTDQGDKVGSIGVVYLDDATEEPTWVTVHTGLFGTRESFVPLLGAAVRGGLSCRSSSRHVPGAGTRRAPTTSWRGVPP